MVSNCKEEVIDFHDLARSELSAISKQFSRSDWHQKGFSVSQSRLCGDLVLELQRRVEGIVDGYYDKGREPLLYRPPAGANQSHIEMYSHVHWSDSLISTIALDPSLAELSASLLTSHRIRLWGTSIIYKYGCAGSINNVSWHRDMTFWQCVSRPALLTFWIALDDTSEANGCLEYAVASHRQPGNGLLPDDRDLKNYLHEPISMQQGQVSIHHCLTGHRSNSNETFGPRRALTIHLMDGDLHYVPSSPSDNHMNVYLLGKTGPSDFDNPYFPLVYVAA